MRHNDFGQPVGDPVDWSPARPPAPVTLTGRRCRLVPLTVAHAPALYAATAPLGGPAWTYLGWEQPASPQAFVVLLSGILSTPGWWSWTVLDRDGSPRGMASFLRADPQAGSIEIGGILHGEGLARTAAATEAHALLAAYAIDELGYRRYEWKCDALNAPSRAAALRLGFRYEGTFRQALVYKGRNRDTAWFALTDGDWPAVRAAYQRWLGPDNLDAAGHQRVRLADLVAAERAVPIPGDG